MIDLAAGAYAATVNPLGASLALLRHRERDLVLPQHGRRGVPSFRGDVLAPWPGRIEDGTYTFGGVEHRLPITEPARRTALHGLVYDVVWEIAERTDAVATLETRIAPTPGYPFTVDLRITYDVAADGLAVTLTATNAGSDPAPFGCGFHPYIACATSADASVVRLGAATHVDVDPVRLLPVGRTPVGDTDRDLRTGMLVGERHLDDGFADLARDDDAIAHAYVDDVEVWWDAALPYAQVFTPAERDAVAVEPCSCPANAFRTGTGVVALEPGASTTVRYGIRQR